MTQPPATWLGRKGIQLSGPVYERLEAHRAAMVQAKGRYVTFAEAVEDLLNRAES